MEGEVPGAVGRRAAEGALRAPPRYSTQPYWPYLTGGSNHRWMSYGLRIPSGGNRLGAVGSG